MEFSLLDDVAEDDIKYQLTDSISDDQLPGEIYNLSHAGSCKLISDPTVIVNSNAARILCF